MTAKSPVSPVVARHHARLEPPPLKKFAVWCGVATSWVALVAALAHATAEERGPHYVAMIIALFVVAPFAIMGFLKRKSHPTITATLFTAMSAAAFAESAATLSGELDTSIISWLFGLVVAASGIVGVFTTLYELDERARHSLRFLIVEFAAICFAAWANASMALAAGLGAGIAFWVMYKMAPPPRKPLHLYKKEPGT